MPVSSPTFEPTSPEEPDAQARERVADPRWRTLEKVATPKLVPVTPMAPDMGGNLFAAGLRNAEVHTPLPPSPSRRHYLYARRNPRRVPMLSRSYIYDDDVACHSDLGGAPCDQAGSAEQSACGSGDSGMHTPKSKGRNKLPDDPFLFSPSAPKRRTRRLCQSPRSSDPVCDAEQDVTSTTGESSSGLDICPLTSAQSAASGAYSPDRRFSMAAGKAGLACVTACDTGLSTHDASPSCVDAAADAACGVSGTETSCNIERLSLHAKSESVGEVVTTGGTACHSGALKIPIPEGFDFSMAICSYGFFCMMPNKWVPPPAGVKAHGTFRRPLRYGKQAERCCTVDISCTDDTCLNVRVDGDLPGNQTEEAEVVAQIKRMCRLDASAFRGHTIESFWHLHPEAKARHFGYLFRSPTVWEDMVKTITICNARWKQSCTMNRLLCTEISSRKGSFPSPWDVCRYSSEELQKTCSLGYRAERVRRLAESIVSGTLDVSFFDSLCIDSPGKPGVQPVADVPAEREEVRATKRTKRPRASATSTNPSTQVAILQKLRSIYGFGTFASENMMQLLGFFNVDAFDSETVRHMREKHSVNLKKPQQVWDAARKHFSCYSPFQFLAYWFELWKGYEAKSGSESPFWTADTSSFVDNQGG